MLSIAQFIVSIGIFFVLNACHQEPVQKTSALTSAAPAEVLIKFKPGVPEDSVRALAAKWGLEQVREIREIGVRVFRTSGRVSTAQVLRVSQAHALVEYAEPNTKVKIPEQQ